MSLITEANLRKSDEVDTLKYRAEIDGLRAIAVIPVVLFHAGLDFFGGGFVGVDVFFVISGYLITTILIGDIERGQFSIVNFYERRARRILPALFFVMMVCTFFAWKSMLPSQMKDFSLSLIAVCLFASNILFWQKTDYFSPSSELNPMLHTWSLAVEEQYYIIFPLFLLFTWRFGKNRVFLIIIVMAVISLLMSEWGWRNQAVANFYLAPTRAWELFAGSISAFLVLRNGVRKNNLLAFLGLTAVIIPIFTYDENTPFPSIYALPPVSGVVLLILYAGKETLVAKILSTKVFVGVGLISYSVYLWHQPVFAFARIGLVEQPSVILMVVLSIASVILGWLSWLYVETPFRNRGTFTRADIFKISGIGLVVFIVLGLVGYLNKGFPSRLEFEELAYHSMKDESGSCFGRIDSFCNLEDKRKKIFVIGDSTIQPLATSLNELQNDFAVVPITAGGCVLINGYSLFDSGVPGYQKSCLSSKADSVLRLIQEEEPLLVIYGGMFSKVLTGLSVDGDARSKRWKKSFRATDSSLSVSKAIHKTVIELSQASETVLLVEFPAFGYDAQSVLLKSSLFNREIGPLMVAQTQLETFHREGRLLIDELKNIANVSEIVSLDFICSEGFCSPIVDGKQMYTDKIHPSQFYTDAMADYLITEVLADFR